MRAITLWQPWASLIAEGAKTIETRPFPHPWRSAVGERVAIHAAARVPTYHECPAGAVFYDGIGDLMFGLHEPFTEEQQVTRGLPADGDLHGFPLPLGAFLATALLTAVVPIGDRWAEGLLPAGCYARVIDDTIVQLVDTDPHRRPVLHPNQRQYGDFTPGRWALLFADVERLPEPVPARGRQGLWICDQ